MPTGGVLRTLGPAGFVGCVTALLLVDLAGWRRSGPLRRGGEPRSAHGSTLQRAGRTSSATLLPAGAGLSALAWSAVGPAPPVLRFLLAAGGLVVAVSGVASRVVALEVSPGVLTVRYAVGSPVALPWTEVTSLRPPRWPLGAWRVIGSPRGCSLMASDLLRAAWALDAVVHGAGLRFAAGAWRRPGEAATVSRTA